jgi:hypothetical protein
VGGRSEGNTKSLRWVMTKNTNATIEDIARILNISLDKLVKLPTKKIDELVDLYLAAEKARAKYDAFMIINQLR